MQNRKRGFSLVEIMVVIVIIGLLGTVVTVGVLKFVSDARITTAKTQMTEFMKALNLYKMEKGSYPRSLDALTQAKSSAGESLLKDIPKDPWGNPYRYRADGSQCSITSYGVDNREGGVGEAADIKMSSSGKNS